MREGDCVTIKSLWWSGAKQGSTIFKISKGGKLLLLTARPKGGLAQWMELTPSTKTGIYNRADIHYIPSKSRGLSQRSNKPAFPVQAVRVHSHPVQLSMHCTRPRRKANPSVAALVDGRGARKREGSAGIVAGRLSYPLFKRLPSSALIANSFDSQGYPISQRKNAFLATLKSRGDRMGRDGLVHQKFTTMSIFHVHSPPSPLGIVTH